MQITSKVVLGTESGVVVLIEGDGQWQRTQTYLEGINVVGLASQGPDRMLAATGEGGFFRIDLGSGDVVRLGAGVLPKRLHSVTLTARPKQSVRRYRAGGDLRE